MKRKLLVAMLLGVALLLAVAVGLAAEEDPITGKIEISPNQVAGLQTIDVTITVSNTSTEATPIAVVLVDPTSKEVADFGTNGEVQLAGGESKTWQGKWDLRQIQLDTGYVYYYIKYTVPGADGASAEQRRSIRAAISQVSSVAGAEVKRTITPTAARKGQTVTIKYDIVNTGTVALKDIVVKEDSDISKKEQTVATIEPGDHKEVVFEVTMGTKDLTSSATVTYKTAKDSKTQTQKIDAATITYGEPKLSAKLTASAKGVAENGTVVLTLELANNGNIDYTGITVTDPTLGEVFTNQQLAAGQKLTLTKEVTLTATTEYQFTVNAVDNTGTSVSPTTDPVKVSVIDPTKQVHLTVTVTPDRTEVYESPGLVRFAIKIENDGPVDAANVVVLYGEMKLYTFASIPAGESRTMTRDAALSQAGKYRFTASAEDAAGLATTFESNDINIAFSVPTPAPATATPPPVPTNVPTFQPSVVPGILDPDVGPVPKLIRSILLPVMIVGGLLLVAGAVLLIIATQRRNQQKRESEAAYDHLERVRRRDYRTPGEPEEAEVQPLGSTQNDEDNFDGISRLTAKQLKKQGEQELPHMKYVRNALERKGELDDEAEGAANADADAPLDLNTASFADIYRQSAQTAKSYADDYGTSFDGDDYGAAADTEGYAEPELGAAEGDDSLYDQPYAADAQQDEAYGEAEQPYDANAYGYADPEQTDDSAEYDDSYAEPNYGEETQSEEYDDSAWQEPSYDENADGAAEQTPPGRHRRARGDHSADA